MNHKFIDKLIVKTIKLQEEMLGSNAIDCDPKTQLQLSNALALIQQTINTLKLARFEQVEHEIQNAIDE